MPLQQVDFKTSVFTGTKKRAGTGEQLAKLLMTGVDTANKVVPVQKALTEQEQKEQDALEGVAYTDLVARWNKGYSDATKDGMLGDSESLYSFNDEFAKDLDALFPTENSKWKNKAITFISQKDGIGHSLLEKEKKLSYETYMTNTFSHMKMADANEEIVESTTINGKELVPNTNRGNTLRYMLSGTTNKLLDDMSDVSGYINNGGTPYTEEDLLEVYGGEVFKSIKDKDSREYKEFKKAISSVAGKIKTAFIEKEAYDYVSNGGGSFEATIAFGDDKLVDKTFKKAINDDLISGNIKGAIEKSNEYRKGTGKGLKLIDNKVNSMFKTRKGDANAYKIFNATRNEYAYDQGVIDNFVMLEVVANQNGWDLTDNDQISNALAEMKIADQMPIPKETQNEFEEELHSRPWYKFGIGDKKYSPSQIAFITERGKAFMRYGDDADDAITKAEELFDSNNKLGNGIPLGMLRLSNETEQEDLELLVKSFSANNRTDDTDLRYIGNDKWKVTDTNSNDSFLFSSSELKNRIGYQRKLQQTRRTITNAMKIGNNLTVDEKKVAKIVRKKALDIFAKQYPDMSKEELNDQADRTFREALDKIEEAEKNRKKEERTLTLGMGSI